jgi:hypothetical protein
MTYTIYVPVNGTAASRQIAPKSAIVAAAGEVDPIFHFEGNVYNSVNLQRFIERLTSAAGRLATNYPTIAKAGFAPSEMKPVGSFNVEFNCIGELIDPVALETWCGESRVEFAGEILPIGPRPLASMNEKILQTARFLGRNGGVLAYRSLAGQLITISDRAPRTALIRGVYEKWEA